MAAGGPAIDEDVTDDTDDEFARRLSSQQSNLLDFAANAMVMWDPSVARGTCMERSCRCCYRHTRVTKLAELMRNTSMNMSANVMHGRGRMDAAAHAVALRYVHVSTLQPRAGGSTSVLRSQLPLLSS